MIFRGLLVLAVSLVYYAGTASQNITSDTYFYGDSPPVYPSPQGTGAGDWSAAYKKAKKLVAMMTIEEKINVTAGYSGPNGCSGNIQPVSSLGFPGLCLNDAGNGLRGTDFVNGYPSAIHVGASWNKSMALERATQVGMEFYTKGVNVALGPVVGPLGRVATGGRNWEGFSNDPYLCGALAYETVSGMQGAGVTTSTKHFIGNEQETWRNPGTNAEGMTTESVSSNIDDQTMHELYLWPFADALRAGSGCIMCSYNRINNSHGCQNSKTLNGLLKEELGFQGFVVSDWFAEHSGVGSALAGLDMSMPNYPFGIQNLTLQYANGSIPESRLDDQVTRIIAAWYQMGQDTGFPAPGVGMASNYELPHTVVDARVPSSKSVLVSGAMEGHVLVKNSNNALPFKSPKLLSIFGYDSAQNPNVNLGLGNARGFGSAAPQYTNYTQWVGGGSGANSPAYVNDPLSAFIQRAYEDDTSVLYNSFSLNPGVDAASDACLVFINAYAMEGYDRPGLHDDLSDGLIQNVAASCSNTMVIIHNAGIRLVDQWIDNDNITAVIFAHLPGQESGRSLVSLMYGDVSFSGKLPYTVAKNESDYGITLNPSEPEGIYWLYPQSDFSEGVYIDYRRFDQLDITPRYEFGFGLTYTTFAYNKLTANFKASASLTPYPANATIVQGGNPRLYDVIATVSVTVSNTGSVAAAEIAQLYVGIPGGPVRQLRGFNKVMISPGASTRITFNLMRRDLSMWDTVAQQWKLQSGNYMVYVGSSSRNLPVAARLTVS